MSLLIEYPLWFLLFCFLNGAAFSFGLYYRRRNTSENFIVLAGLVLLRFLSVSLITFLLLFAGCGSLQDSPKSFVGSSTRVLEAGRSDSIYQVYPSDMPRCFDAVVQIAAKNHYYIFSQDQARGLVVLLNIPGCVDTTEVGVFLTELPAGEGIRVELSSRSTPAKRAVAKVLFSELKERLSK